jgi:hypothetical protein
LFRRCDRIALRIEHEKDYIFQYLKYVLINLKYVSITIIDCNNVIMQLIV